MKIDVEITKENTLGLVKLDSNNSYYISGILSCIGIVIRSFKYGQYGDIIFCDGLAIHFIDGLEKMVAHFTENGITKFGDLVIDELKKFIKTNKKCKIQLDLITNSKNNKRHELTEKIIKQLNELFTLFVKENEVKNFEIKYTLNTGRIEFNPKIWNF